MLLFDKFYVCVFIDCTRPSFLLCKCGVLSVDFACWMLMLLFCLFAVEELNELNCDFFSFLPSFGFLSSLFSSHLSLEKIS